MSTPSHPAFEEAMADLRVLGIEPCESGQRYGLVEARSNHRWWMLPLASGAQTRAGLDLFHPVSLAAQLIKTGASFACMLGLQRCAFRSGPRLTGVSRLAKTFPEKEASSVAIFTGTDGPHRKTTLQFGDRKSEILGYAKLSRSQQVIPWIQTEARVLQEVAELHLTTANVPRVLDLQLTNDFAQLITDSKKAGAFRMPKVFGRAHATFLAELATRTFGKDWEEHLDALHIQLDSLRSVMSPEWQTRMGEALHQLQCGPPLPMVMTHGDFTPWNTFLGDRIYVFDWEYAGRRALGHDLVHFTLSKGMLSNAARLEAAALSALEAVHPELNARRSLLAYLCNQTLLFALREQQGLKRVDGWSDSARLRPLLDQVLKPCAKYALL